MCQSVIRIVSTNEKIVVAVSLCKAYGAGGACIVFGQEVERERVRMCGGPQLFSGPMQPPMLGASLASAKVALGRLHGRSWARAALVRVLAPGPLFCAFAGLVWPPVARFGPSG